MSGGKEADRFCPGTALDSCNAKCLKSIVDRVEARRIPPAALAQKAVRIMTTPRPRFTYGINRNPLLLLNALPKGLQLRLIRRVLKQGRGHAKNGILLRPASRTGDPRKAHLFHNLEELFGRFLKGVFAAGQIRRHRPEGRSISRVVSGLFLLFGRGNPPKSKSVY